MYHVPSVASATTHTVRPFGNLWKNIWASALLCLCAHIAAAAPPLKVWNGSVSTNWATAGNWTPAAVPIAGDSVRIPDAPANQPVILTSTLAKAKNVFVLSGASLVINSGAELELASTFDAVAFTNQGTSVNNGTLRIKSGFQGIYAGGSFTNNGTLLLGEATSTPYSFREEGIAMYDMNAGFVNNAAASIVIWRPGNNGILMFATGTSFTNDGAIRIRTNGLNPNTAGTADGIDVRNGSYTNNATGDIVISTISANGLNCRGGGSFTNHGSIKIGNVGLTTSLAVREGISNNGSFDNKATGQITIDTCSNSGILNQGAFYNSGTISIGLTKVNSVGNIGVANLFSFYNYSGATLSIKNAKTGILTGGLGGILTNNAGGIISIGQIVEDGIYQFGLGGTNNSGNLNIGTTGSIGRYAVHNACQFLNQLGAVLTINNTANNAILNTSNTGIDGEVKNAGKITIDNAANAGGAAILNNANCKVENLGCAALIHITSNNVISNSGTMTNEGNIIENASGNSSITDNSGTIQNLNGGIFFVTGINTGFVSTFAGAIWTGCFNTNWASIYNWNDLAVPVASEDVLIPDRSNDPTILGGTAAVAKSVDLRYNATLTLNASSTLTISGSTSTGLYNKGTVENAGLLDINTTGHAGLHNEGTWIPGPFVYQGGLFNNNTGGELRINGTTAEGIYLSNATLNNYSKIKIGNTGNIGNDGIELRSSGLDNKSTGEIAIDGTTGDGIFVFNNGLTNSGKITIGGNSAIGGNGITNAATITNNAGAEIKIDRTTQNGIYNSFASFDNSGLLKIGSTANTGGSGISNQNANFNNYATGEITIDRTLRSGIYNYYRASSIRAINNSGKIYIGKTANIGGPGIENYAAFNNNTDGEITIDRTSNSGISVLNDNDSNTHPAVFSNAGKLTIGGIAGLGDNGIQNRMNFNNNAGGRIWIDRSASDGIFNATGTFDNAGTMTIGGTVAPTGDGMENAATFNNKACGEIILFDNLKNDGTFTNTGLLRMNTALPHTNSATFTNDGIIEYPQGSLIPSVTNNDVIVKAVTGECPVANALDLGAMNSFTVSTTWYKNANLTNAAGTYNQAANAFTATALAEGTTTTLYFTVSDGANGCTRTVSIRLTYEDTTPPTIACPANMTLLTDDDGGADCSVTLTYTANFTDNCDGSGPSVLVSGPASGTSLAVSGTPYTVTRTYTDMAGNTVANNCVFTVTVQDNTKPAFTCPAPNTVLGTTGAANCSVLIPHLVAMVTDAADNCALKTVNPVTQDVPAGIFTGASHAQTIPVTVSVTDNASPANVRSCTIVFTVNDDDYPTISCPSDMTQNTDPDQCTAVVSYATPAFADNCSGPVLQRTDGLSSGAAFPKGLNTVTWKVTDGAGLMATCQFHVVVNDGQLPAISCPGSMTRTNDPGQCGALVTYTPPVVSDNCQLMGLDHLSGGLSGSLFPVGTTTVVWMATDESNNTKTCSFEITVTDAQPPAISCPAQQTRNTDLNVCTAAVAYPDPTVSDNCTAPAPTVSYQLSGATTGSWQAGTGSGSAFNKGITTVTLRATDGAGMTRTCTFRVVVLDAQAPVFTLCPSGQTVFTTSNSCASAAVTYATPTATDNCTPAPTVVLIGGPASGSVFPAGATPVTWRATDGAGRTALCTFSITVTDNTLPLISCGAPVVVSGSGSPCGASVFYPTPTATDNCGIASVFLQSGVVSGSNFPAGTTLSVWRATDVNGLTATCAVQVTVNCPGIGNRAGEAVQERTAAGMRGGTADWDFALAPNPARDVVYITLRLEEQHIPNPDAEAQVLLLDAQGRLLVQQTFSEQSGTLRLETGRPPAGIYWVSVRRATHTLTKKLCIADSE